MQRTDADYLRYDPFEGDRDVKIRARTVKLVTTRKPQRCHGYDGMTTMHDMPVGTRARFESAVVDGEWGRYYVCVTCMDKWLSSL